MIAKLGTGPGIKVPFELDAEGYRKPVTPVHEALQEALVNALIHADHFGQGGVVIERWADKLEFSNPGTLLVSHEQLLQGGISECRNKALQRMFQMLGVGDKAGSVHGAPMSPSSLLRCGTSWPSGALDPSNVLGSLNH